MNNRKHRRETSSDKNGSLNEDTEGVIQRQNFRGEWQKEQQGKGGEKLVAQEYDKKPAKGDFDPSGYDKQLIEAVERDTIMQHNPNVHWDDIAGLKEVKRLLQEAFVLSILMLGYIRPCKATLMVGPPGTGKTLLAKAVATESKATFFNLCFPALVCKYERLKDLVRLVFEMAHHYAPSIIFIDEIDCICSNRCEGMCDSDRMLVRSELLKQMDALSESTAVGSTGQRDKDRSKLVIMLAATNYPWKVDEEFRRTLVYIPLLDIEGCRQLLDINLKGIPLTDDVDLNKISRQLDGYSGADITNVCREASMMPMRRHIQGLSLDEIKQLSQEQLDLPTSMDDFQTALKKVSKSVFADDLMKYEKWMTEFGSV